MAGNISSYLAPPQWASEDTKLGWLREAIQEGQNYLKAQRCWGDIDQAVEILEGGGNEEVPKVQSRVHLNMIKRDVREVVATLANMRPLWGYKTDNPELQHQGMVLNKMLQAWYLNTFADRSVRTALQYASTSTGWLSPIWSHDFWVAGRGDIELKAYGPRQVLPVQIGPDHNIQKAYAVTICLEVPLSIALAMHPTQISKIIPSHSTPTWMKKGIRKVQRFLSPVLNAFGQGKGKEMEESNFPTVDIYNTYILDLSCNMTDKIIPMGDPGTSWYYEVPPYGSDIDSGMRDKAGNVLSRKANFDDARMYPLRRLIVSTEHGVLEDGPSKWWHGKVPLAKLTLDDQPWDFLGTPLTKDGASLQSSNTRAMRAIDDAVNARLDPVMQYDENMISRALMERLNPRRGGQRVATNMQMGEAAKPLLPAEYYDVPAWIREEIVARYEAIHHLMGLKDVMAIAKAKQIPAGDSLEKLMELAGPLITDMSRNMERPLRDVGEMVKSLMFQFYGVRRRVQILGPDGVTEEDFDYEPGNMIPSHTPDEIVLIKRGEMKADQESSLSQIQRAKIHQNSFYFHITPNSMHQITQMSRKLMFMQLFIRGFPIDPWTVADAMDIPNFGAKPETSDGSVFGNWIAWIKMKQELTPQGPGAGRKPTGQQAPSIQSKDGGTRSTIRESPR